MRFTILFAGLLICTTASAIDWLGCYSIDFLSPGTVLCTATDKDCNDPVSVGGAWDVCGTPVPGGPDIPDYYREAGGAVGAKQPTLEARVEARGSSGGSSGEARGQSINRKLGQEARGQSICLELNANWEAAHFGPTFSPALLLGVDDLASLLCNESHSNGLGLRKGSLRKAAKTK
jgi:hypothetical protein